MCSSDLKAHFRRAGVDPDKPPRTWYEMPAVLGELRESGSECPYVSAWPTWVHLENMSAWHNQEFATNGNGMGGLDTKLSFNTRLMVRWISVLTSWHKSEYFTYSGRGAEAEARFAKGECAIVTASSSRQGDLHRTAKFDWAVAQLPHIASVLVKGSRFMRMEQVVAALTQACAAQATQPAAQGEAACC